MEKEKLEHLYNKVVQEIRFHESVENKGWMPKFGPNDYRSVIRHGTYKGVPAMLKVSPHEELVNEATKAWSYQHDVFGKPVLQMPQILTSGKVGAAQFLIQREGPGGKRILEQYPYSNEEEKKEVARLYWATVQEFPAFPSEYSSVLEFFIKKLNMLMEHARKDENLPQNGFITPKERNKVSQYILDRAYELKMEPFFSRFSNTDVTKDGTLYFVWDTAIVSRPEEHGAASWIWGATLYAYDWQPKKWMDEVDAWLDAFVDNPPPNRHEVRKKIKINLQERMLGALLVDLPLKRSPFDALSTEEIQKARAVARTVLHLD